MGQERSYKVDQGQQTSRNEFQSSAHELNDGGDLGTNINEHL